MLKSAATYSTTTCGSEMRGNHGKKVYFEDHQGRRENSRMSSGYPHGRPNNEEESHDESVSSPKDGQSSSLLASRREMRQRYYYEKDSSKARRLVKTRAGTKSNSFAHASCKVKNHVLKKRSQPRKRAFPRRIPHAENVSARDQRAHPGPNQRVRHTIPFDGPLGSRQIGRRSFFPLTDSDTEASETGEEGSLSFKSSDSICKNSPQKEVHPEFRRELVWSRAHEKDKELSRRLLKNRENQVMCADVEYYEPDEGNEAECVVHVKEPDAGHSSNVESSSTETIRYQNEERQRHNGSRNKRSPKEALGHEGHEENVPVKAFDHPRGMKNSGRTCYLNAVLQALCAIPQVRECAMRSTLDLKSPTLYEALGNDMLGGHILYALRNLQLNDEDEPLPVMDTTNLSMVLWDTGEQTGFSMAQDQDAHEFLMFARMKLTEIMKACEERGYLRYFPVGNTRDALADSDRGWQGPTGYEERACRLMEQCFSGRTVVQTTCMGCHSETYRKEEWADISLPVKIENGTVCNDVREALSYYFEPVLLSEADRYDCSSCKRKSNANVVSKLEVLPDVLTIHLVLFAQKMDGSVEKISRQLLRSLTLDVSPFVRLQDNNTVYDLSAAVIHSGSSLSSGHYIALVKGCESGRWFLCNDESVLELEKKMLVKFLGGEELSHLSPYLLFYTRRMSR